MKLSVFVIYKRLKNYTSGKEDLEAELYSRFVLVLNEKKAKIRSLQQNLTQLQDERYIKRKVFITLY